MKLGEMQRYKPRLTQRSEFSAPYPICGEADDGDYVLFSDASAQLSEAQRRVEELEGVLQAYYEVKKHEIHEIGMHDYNEDWNDEECRDFICQCHAPDNYVCIYCRARAALRVGTTK